jgi:hypothetical protein
VIVNEQRAIELVARERARIEALLAEQSRQIRADASLGRQQTGESADSGTALEAEAASRSPRAGSRPGLTAYRSRAEKPSRTSVSKRSLLR